MSNYRRAYIPSGTFFFTVKTERNAPVFRNEFAVTIPSDIIRETQQLWHFEINAIVLLPDHLHAIWTLPPDDSNFSKRLMMEQVSARLMGTCVFSTLREFNLPVMRMVLTPRQVTVVLIVF